MDFFSFLEPRFSEELPKKIYAIFEVLSRVPLTLHCQGQRLRRPYNPG
jgi:hypothetical protein